MINVIFILSLFLLTCSCNNSTSDSLDSNNITIIDDDTTAVTNIFIYCNNFYRAIDNSRLLITNTGFHLSIQDVIRTKEAYFETSNIDTINLIKEIFFENFIIEDSVESNYKKQGDLFLVIKKNNKVSTLSYMVDSIWAYNQKYSLKYKKVPTDELLKLLKYKEIDCVW